MAVASPFASWVAGLQASQPNVQGLHPRVLAHLGDGVFELLVRHWLLSQPTDWTNEALHKATTAKACMDFQAQLLEALLPQLSEAEEAWVKAGRNLAIPKARRHQQQCYRWATGFEALVGAWWLCDPQRLQLLEPLLNAPRLPLVSSP